MSFRKGFTLIELLVTISIMAIVLGAAVTSYKDFQARGEVVQAGKTVVTNLRFAQNQAFAGVKIAGNYDVTNPSDTLNGWYFKITGPRSYEAGTFFKVTGQRRAKTFTPVPNNITLTMVPNISGNCLLFQTINRGVGTCFDPSGPSSFTIILTSSVTSSVQPKITVTSVGDISYVDN